jgi:broad specificity phosphatase PhoE
MSLQSIARSILALVVVIAPTLAHTQTVPPPAPTVVIIVRHAEKAAEPANDPELSEIGKERAQQLAVALKDAQVGAVLHTATTRTRETARPVAEQFGITPEVFANSRAMAAAVARHPGKTIVVVGHSNTVMPYIAALGGPTRENLCDHNYDGLYTVVISGGTARLVEGRYGPPNPAPTEACGGMLPPAPRP